MALTPDTIELAQQIADALEERIGAIREVFYHSACHTAEDCFEHLTKPLSEKHNIDTLLESLPPHAAESLKEKYSKLISSYDPTCSISSQDLHLNTVKRYVNNLISELRNIAQESDQNKGITKQKVNRPGPRKKHSDEKMQQVMNSFNKFSTKCKDVKQAWYMVAEHHGFKSWKAARQACYRFRKRKN